MATIYMSANEKQKRQAKQKAKGAPKLIGEKPKKLVTATPKVKKAKK